MKAEEDTSDGDFWDLAEDGKKTPKRKKSLAKGSSTFPSLSVFISCQEETAKDDSGNTVSINIPNIGNVSELRINQQVDTQEKNDGHLKNNSLTNHKIENKDVATYESKPQPTGDEVNGEFCRSHTDTDSDSDEEIGKEPTKNVLIESTAHSSHDGRPEIQSEGSLSDEKDDHEVLFFDNSEQKNGVEISRIDKQRQLSRNNSIQRQDSITVLNTRQCPPYQLLKHWLYRGRKLLVASDGHLAVDAFVRSFALARMVHGDSHWRTARCKVFLARSYFYILNFAPQALTHATEACDIINSCLTSSIVLNKKPQVHHTLAWSYLVQGEAKTTLKMYQAAFPALSKSLTHAKEFSSLVSRRKKLIPSMQLDDPTDLTVNILSAQAKLYESTNNIYRARLKLEEALNNVGKTQISDQRETQFGCLLKLYGEFLLRFAGKSREGIFSAEDTQQELDEGIQCLKKALEIVQKHKRPGSSKECELRYIIAKHHLKHGLESPKSIWWELHKLKIWSSRITGDFSGQTKAIQESLVQVLLKQGNFDEAIKELNELLFATQNSFGTYNVQVCTILRQLSNVYVMKKDLPMALMVLEESLCIESLLFGQSSRRVQTLKLKIKDLLFQVPQETRKKMFKKYPDLQQRPPFKSYC